MPGCCQVQVLVSFSMFCQCQQSNSTFAAKVSCPVCFGRCQCTAIRQPHRQIFLKSLVKLKHIPNRNKRGIREKRKGLVIHCNVLPS